MIAIRRRTVLLAAALGPVSLLAACTPGSDSEVTIAEDPARIDALADERMLVTAYETALAAQPSLAAQLQPILDQHRAHIADLGGQNDSTPPTGSGGTAPEGTPSTSTSGSPSGSGSSSDLPGNGSTSASPVSTVSSLRELERQAASLRLASCTRAGSAALARTLSLIGASEAQHVVELAP